MSMAAHGLWRIQSDAVIPVDRAWTGPLTVLVPSEKILTIVVDLPFPSRRKRLEAAPFAIEGEVAEPLDKVHVALGMEVSDRRHLCGVVRHSVMRDWIDLLVEAGLDQSILLPDALALPAPPMGSWRVAIEGERALVRTGDGRGFAAELAILPTAWEADGRPRLIVEGGVLPEIMREGMDEISLDSADGSRPAVVTPAVDLRQGPYSAIRNTARSPWRLVAGVVGIGLVAHLALMAIDTLALDHMADNRETETRRLIAERQPGLEASGDLVAAVDQIAPADVGGDGPFVRLFGRTSRALTGQPLAYRSIRYDVARPMTLAVTAADAAAVEAAVSALEGAAIPARSALDPIADGDPAPGGVNALITLETLGGGR